MLVPMDTLLKDATIRGYAVPAPNVWNYETMRAALDVAMELRAPLILDYAAGAHGEEHIEAVAVMARFLALGPYAAVPVALNLDHGSSFEVVMKAIKAGFSSVMIDRSTSPLEENIRESREVCKAAHAVGVSVEGELGHVGSGARYEQERDAGLTDPWEAAEYVAKTGVDCLAVAIGTAHGRYAGAPMLDHARLEQIRKVVGIPLVLHGGSGTGEDAIKRAVQLGIAKVNLFTDLAAAGLTALRQALAVTGSVEPTLVDAWREGVRGYRQELERYTVLLGARDRW